MRFKLTVCILSLFLFVFNNNASTEIDFVFTTSDGTHLDCTKFIPDGNPPSGGWPAVILCHGFGLDKYDQYDWASDFADEGFYSLIYSMRGQGESSGYTNLISTTEMNDLNQIIQYVKTHDNVNAGKVGIGGGSQGGIIPYMAVCNGTSVKCIAPEFASPEFASSWIENGGIKMTLLWSLSYTSDVVRYNPTVASMRNWILSSAKDKWDSLAYYVPLNRDFMNKVSQCQVPVFSSSVWQDKFFNASGMTKSAGVLPAQFRMYFGAMDGHGSDTSQAEFDYQADVTGDWFDYWLKNIQNGVMNSSYKYAYACSSFPMHGTSWTFTRYYSSIWPPAGLNNVQLYFYPNNQLLPWAYTGSQTNIAFLNNVINPNLTMLTCVNYEFTGSQFNSQFGKTELTFDTPPLLQDARLVGIPKVNLYYQSDADLCQFNFQIWDVQSNGNKRLVTRADWTDRNYTPNTLKYKQFDGELYGHIFKSGDKIRVILTNLDNITNDGFLRTNPFELPVLKRANNKLYISGSSKSYIELPLMNFVIGVEKISSIIPTQYKLEQNYPNPFNPTTKIKFEIPSLPLIKGAGGMNVVLKIYDILGHEVETLVNEKLEPGYYETKWDSGDCPCGTYFYRLVAGDFVETKKMVLVK